MKATWILVTVSLVSGLAVLEGGETQAADAAATTITFKVVKAAAGMAQEEPAVSFLSAAESWKVRQEVSWSGENPREIFFTVITADPKAELPQVAVKAPGVEPQRVIVGKTDVPFSHTGDTITFTLVRDTRNAMLLNQVLPDCEGGLPIHVYHNWLIRQDGHFRGKRCPEVEVRAVLNYLVAAREALKLMGGHGPKDDKAYHGDITLMSFEVACARAHKDYPPHVHIMLWVPGYVGGEVPHFYMDQQGRIFRNQFDILGDEGGKFPERAALIAEKKKRSGEYGPGKPCQLLDLGNRLALQLTITPEGGLLLSDAKGESYLLIGDLAGPGDAVLVRQGDTTLLRVRVDDDAEMGQTDITVEHLRDRNATRVLRQSFYYDPFTGLERKMDEADDMAAAMRKAGAANGRGGSRQGVEQVD